MAVFILETEAVTSAASSVNSLASEVANIGSSVSGYDTSCEDGFNFAGAKGVIAANIEACSVKIQNTAKVMESVVSSHTELQNKLKFQDPASAAATDTGTNTGTNTGANTGTNTGTNTDSGSNNTYSGSDYSGSWGGGGGDGGGGEISTPTPTEEEKKDKKGVITSKLSKLGYAVADEKSVSDETKALLKDALFKYDNNGYAMIGERYVIACDSSLANIGDVIRFTQKDGSVVECVVGITTVSEKYKDMVNFIVDSKAEGIKAIDVTKTLFTSNTKIENIGTLVDVRKAELGSDVAKALEKSIINTPTEGATTVPATTVPVTTGTETTTTTTVETPATTTTSEGTQLIDYTKTEDNTSVQV